MLYYCCCYCDCCSRMFIKWRRRWSVIGFSCHVNYTGSVTSKEEGRRKNWTLNLHHETKGSWRKSLAKARSIMEYVYILIQIVHKLLHGYVIVKCNWNWSKRQLHCSLFIIDTSSMCQFDAYFSKHFHALFLIKTRNGSKGKITNIDLNVRIPEIFNTPFRFVRHN